MHSTKNYVTIILRTPSPEWVAGSRSSTSVVWNFGAVPHKGFNWQIGALAGLKVAPDRRVLSATQWHANVHEWLPTDGDRSFVRSLMGRVTDPGTFANWIAPPEKGSIRRKAISNIFASANRAGAHTLVGPACSTRISINGKYGYRWHHCRAELSKCADPCRQGGS
jgi:hypothetical protein